MTTQELIEKYTENGDFVFGIDKVMDALRPNALYELSIGDGIFTVTRWDEGQTFEAPTSEEIREEYIRHQTIKEVLTYIEQKAKA